MGPGEIFLRDIYNLLTQDSDKWKRTLLLAMHDEHGGFFDHVRHSRSLPRRFRKVRFIRFHSRAPAQGFPLCASPWIPPGTVFKGSMDHTSILQLLAEKFDGSPDYNEEVRPTGIRDTECLGTYWPKRWTSQGPTSRLHREIPFQSGGAKPALEPQTDSQQAFTAAAKELLGYDRKRALEKYPELVQLPEEPAPTAQDYEATSSFYTRFFQASALAIRPSAFSRLAIVVAKERRIYPSLPNAEPGTTATPPCSSRYSLKAISLLSLMLPLACNFHRLSDIGKRVECAFGQQALDAGDRVSASGDKPVTFPECSHHGQYRLDRP